MGTPSLRREISAWDDKDAGAIRGVYERRSPMRGFVASLIRFTAEPDLECGATWLLKHHLEAGHTLSADQARAFYAASARCEGWAARLHALQIMDFVAVPAGAVRDAKRLIERGLADENILVRAWAYNGFARLAETHPRDREEAERLLNDAEASETAASVKARIRNIRKRWNRR